MNKPNSVQWFLDKLIEHRIIIVDQTTYGDKVKPKHEILLEQAKAMHKEEVLSFDTLLHKHEMEALNNNTILLTKEEFYNETYGGNNEQQ